MFEPTPCITYSSSLDNVEVKWLDEIHEHCPGVKLCLVALKCDLREDQNTLEKLARQGESPVTYEDVGRNSAILFGKQERDVTYIVILWRAP